MMRIGRVLPIEVDFKKFVVIFAPEILVPAGFNIQYGICSLWDCS